MAEYNCFIHCNAIYKICTQNKQLKKEALFELIHSLTKSEKRQFKLMSLLHSGDKSYLKLFDEIEKQKKYDEEKIKENIKKRDL